MGVARLQSKPLLSLRLSRDESQAISVMFSYQTDHHRRHWGENTTKKVVILPFSFIHISLTVPRNVIHSCPDEPHYHRKMKKQGEKNILFSFYMHAAFHSIFNVTQYIDLTVEWCSTISSARAALIQQTLGKSQAIHLIWESSPKCTLPVHSYRASITGTLCARWMGLLFLIPHSSSSILIKVFIKKLPCIIIL